jgi:hypothetical protein
VRRRIFSCVVTPATGWVGRAAHAGMRDAEMEIDENSSYVRR